MNPGKLRTRVNLMAPMKSVLADGSPAESFAAYATAVPADVQTLSANQILQARQVFSDVSVKVRIRWRQGVKPNHQVLIGGGAGRTLSIKGVLEDSKNLWLDLMCEELSDGT